MNTVSVICPCGAHFDREVRRGRPQVWCPSCIAKPFDQRVRVEEVVAEAAPRNAHDKYWRNRDAIEAAVVIVDADYKIAFASLVAAGADPWGAEAAALTVEYSDALKAVYAPYKPDTSSKADTTEPEGESE